MIRYFNTATAPQYVALVKAVMRAERTGHNGNSPADAAVKPGRFQSLDDLIKYAKQHPELNIKSPDEKSIVAKNKHLIGLEGGYLRALDEGINLVREYEAKHSKPAKKPGTSGRNL